MLWVICSVRTEAKRNCHVSGFCPCPGFSWDWMNFLHSNWYGAVFWIWDENNGLASASWWWEIAQCITCFYSFISHFFFLIKLSQTMSSCTSIFTSCLPSLKAGEWANSCVVQSWCWITPQQSNCFLGCYHSCLVTDQLNMPLSRYK